jgi:hypothetical protein
VDAGAGAGLRVENVDAHSRLSSFTAWLPHFWHTTKRANRPFDQSMPLDIAITRHAPLDLLDHDQDRQR